MLYIHYFYILPMQSKKIGIFELISSIYSENGCPVIRISELFHEQLRYVILMRFNLSNRPILNNISGKRSLLLKKWQSYGKIAIFTLKSLKNINLSTFIYVDFFRFMLILFNHFLVFSDFFRFSQCRFWEFQGGSEKIGINRKKSGCPPPPMFRRPESNIRVHYFLRNLVF